ncbi:MAG: cytochrome c oxidase subunit II [Gemmatimonadetes bacterium]|nr:cytochrome c oxidase subunit II [Gemmatimonadota bacterium]
MERSGSVGPRKDRPAGAPSPSGPTPRTPALPAVSHDSCNRGRSNGPDPAAATPSVTDAGRRLPGSLRAGLLACAPLLGACGGPQSALTTASATAERIAHLWWWMAAGAAVLWVLVVGLATYAVLVRPGKHGERASRLLIVGGGAVLPTVVLTGLLIYGLAFIPELLEPGPEDGLRIEVVGEQWWWRVRYVTPDGSVVEAANEVRLPVGRRVELRLSSPDVIHSFWIPSLGGKMDMIPGRTTRIALEPGRTGVFRGACAEYCGASHALMAFDAVVLAEADFQAWLDHQAEPAATPGSGPASRGRDAFLRNGCGACHTVRGTPADGVVGPDLTHVGSRLSLAAGTLPNEPEAFRRWIARTGEVKPGVHMPAFGMLPGEEVRALAAYMESLQ